MTEEKKHPLDPIENETAKANAALLDYYNMGPGRALTLLAQRYEQQWKDHQESPDLYLLPPTKNRDTLKQWSSKYHWQRRVLETQTLEQKQREETDVHIWAERRADIRQRDFEMGRQLRDIVVATLEQLPNFIKRQRRVIPGQNGEPDREIITLAIKEHALLRAAELSSKLERAGAGIEDVTILKGTGEKGEFIIQYISNIGEDDI